MRAVTISMSPGDRPRRPTSTLTSRDCSSVTRMDAGPVAVAADMAAAAATTLARTAEATSKRSIPLSFRSRALGACRHFDGRKLDPERRSAAGDAHEVDLATVRLDDGAGERKAEAAAGDAARRRVPAEELGEDLLLLVGRDAEPAVAYAHAYRTVAL